MFKKKRKRNILYSKWAYKRGGGGLISGILYSFENGWAYIRGLKTGGGLESGILRYVF